MSQQPLVQLNDGRQIPQLGLGVWQASDEEARSAVAEALRVGYRSIDTAAIYKNEVGVGQGIADAGLPREDVFVTTKIWNSEQGLDSARRALEDSLRKLKLDYVDLLLIHWPAPSQDKFVDTWRALIKAQQDGLVKSIGVSNFKAEHLQRLIDETGVKPVLDQVELHPYMQQAALRQTLADLDIHAEAWSPLAQNKALADPVIQRIAEQLGKTPAQVVIRWHVQNGVIVIPKSVTPERIRSNFAVFDFELDAAAMQAIAGLNKDQRIGPDPAVFA
ncbi:aldo/keto reductase [Amantichitinum ursilacus]|uniref:Putative oxidoreductase n=1 Tax=Amantichitinum ursilacus TaxID=857265 RepID=A0A0N0GNV4_9NEIS|nr:aldo/keto reductase [Amantichitinum ursilacus]KPC53183.1 putative oxidoreductase [Amantichitinum ursilacus]